MRIHACLALYFSFIFSFSALGQTPAAKPNVAKPATKTVDAPQAAAPPSPGAGTPAKEIEQIDGLINKVAMAKDKVTKDAALGKHKMIELINSREAFCLLDVKACSNLTKLKMVLCTDQIDPMINIVRMWRSIYLSFKKDDKAMAAFVKNIGACQSYTAVGEMVGINVFSQQAAADGMKETLSALAKSVAADYTTVPFQLDKSITLGLDAVGAMTTIKPVPVNATRECMLMLLGWLSKTDINKLPVTTLNSVVQAMNLTLPIFGNGKAVVDLVKRHPTLLQKVDGGAAMETLTVMCNHYRDSNQPMACMEEINNMKKAPNTAGKFAELFLIEEARVYYVQGKYDEAFAKMKAARESANKTGNTKILPWLNSVEATMEFTTNKLPEAKQHIEQFENDFSKSNPTLWVAFYLPNQKAALLLQSQDYNGAETLLTKLNTDLTTSVSGAVDTLAWAQLHLMTTYALKGDTKAVSDMHAKLKSTVSQLPSYTFLDDIGNAVAKGANGTYASSDLEPARKKVGAKYPDVQRFEQLISRMKK